MGRSTTGSVSNSVAASTVSSLSSTSSTSGSKLAERLQETTFWWFYLFRDRSFPRLAFCVLLVELAQLVCFSFDERYTFWDTLDIIHKIGYFRTGPLYSTYHDAVNIVWTIFAFVIGLALLTIWIVWDVRKGETRVTRKVKVLQYAVEVFPAFYMPSLELLLRTAICDNATNTLLYYPAELLPCWSGKTPIPTAFSIFVVALLIPFGFGIALFDFTFIPTQKWPNSAFSMVNPRSRVLLFLFETILCLAAVIFPSIKQIGTNAHYIFPALIIFCSLSVIAWLIAFIPYHTGKANRLRVAALSVMLAGGIAALIGSIRKDEDVISLIIFLVLGILLAVVSSILCIYRFRTLTKIKADPEEEISFTREFEVEVSTRLNSTAEVTDTNRINDTFAAGLEQFPDSAEIRIAYAIFMLTQHNTESLQIASIQLHRARQFNDRIRIDGRYILYCAERLRQNLVIEFDGGAEEIQSGIKRAERYQNRARQYMVEFWRSLSNDSDLNSLPLIVASIERNEQNADEIYKSLMSKFPKSARVLRHYGVFLEEIKNDIELSRRAFKIADSIEEEKSQHHRKKGKNSSRKVKRAQSQMSESSEASEEDVYVSPRKALKAGSTDRTVKFGGAWVEEEDEISNAKRVVKLLSLPGTPVKDNRSKVPGEDIELRQWNDSHSSSDMSSIDANRSDATIQERRDMIKRRKLRERIDNSKSDSLKKLNLVIIVTLLVLLVDSISLFTASDQILLQNSENLDILREAGRLRTMASSVPQLLRLYQYNIILNNNATAVVTKERAQTRLDYMSETVAKLKGNTDSYGDVRKLWTTVDIDVEDLVPTNGTAVYIKLNLYDLILRFVEYGRAFLTETNINRTTSPNMKYVFDNGPFVLSPRVDALLGAYKDKSDFGIKSLTIALATLLPASVLVVAVLTWRLFLPAVLTIKNERQEALKLFLLIPKHVVTDIFQGLVKHGEEKDLEAITEEGELEGRSLDDQNDQVTSIGLPIIHQLSIRYAVAIFLILVLTFAMFGVTISWTLSFSGRPAELDDAVSRQTQGTMLAVWTVELILNDPLVLPPTKDERLELMQKAADGLEAVHQRIKYGGDGRKGSLGRSKIQDQILFNTSCNAFASCTGLESEVVRMSKAASELLHPSPGVRNTQYTLLLNLTQPGLGSFDNNTVLSADTFLEEDKADIERIRTLLSILFAIGFAFLVVIFGILKPVTTKIKEENARTMKMLLLLPLEVIESVPSIRDFLEKGLQDKSHKNIKDAFQESQERNRAILEASGDAVVILDEEGIIQVFSKAAEIILGYPANEILGKNFAEIIPIPEDASKNERDEMINEFSRVDYQKELLLCKQDGSVISVMVNTSEGMLSSGKRFYALSISDLTEKKCLLENIDAERDRTDKLLRNVFPEMIAEYIKTTNALENNQKTPLESYKSATILFADIVGFTTMCSKTDPATVLEIISDLFSRWDGLIQKHGLEKVKTIGDCMMVVGGVPVRSSDHPTKMIELAIAMLESIRDYNKSSGRDLDIRIGINTGPVLAGLVGRTRTVFDLWGDSVNTASRMESSGVPGRIQVSASTYELVSENYRFEERGKVNVKGKGEMSTFLYVSRKLNVTEDVFSISQKNSSASADSLPVVIPTSEDELDVNADVLLDKKMT